jgi:hypothetical protein
VVIYIVIPVLGYLRQEDTEFKVILDYIVRPFSKKKKKERKEKGESFSKEKVFLRSVPADDTFLVMKLIWTINSFF